LDLTDYLRWTGTGRQFVRSSLLAVAAVLALFVFFFYTHRFYSDRFHRTTGRAEWIWAEHQLASGRPVAFFASHEFAVPEQRRYVHLNVAAQQLYTIFLNGRLIGGSIDDAVSLDRYDISDLAAEGLNRLVVAARSDTGVGGVLVSVDFAPMAQNAVISGRHWSVEREWRAHLLTTAASAAETPQSLGRPPIGRWNYPPRRPREVMPPRHRSVEPLSVTPVQAGLPEVRIVAGFAVAGRREAEASVFDFGPSRGRIVIRRQGGEQEVVRLRFLNLIDELLEDAPAEGFVMAAGESEALDPRVRDFRYVAVFESDARISLVTELQDRHDSGQQAD
jgi:hypothetical protein